MTKTRILLIFGGESTEHDVSIASARNVFAALDNAKYDTQLCYISRNGRWQFVQDIEQLEGGHELLSPDLGMGMFTTSGGSKIAPHVLLPILHGANGEDGSVQGLAQLMHIPVVGCGVLGAAICMDKEVTKRLLRTAGIGVTDYVLHCAYEPAPDFTEIMAALGSTVFVKPANQGSSVGVHKVRTAAAFAEALKDAHRYSRKVLIEAAAAGREIECAVLGNDHPKASPAGEIKPGQEFYSYDDKYAKDSQAQVIAPADLPEEVAAKVRQTAMRAYRALECRGLARVDFFVAQDGSMQVNEVNAMPGFTNISMYPKMWQAGGLQYPGLVNTLINLALEK